MKISGCFSYALGSPRGRRLSDDSNSGLRRILAEIERAYAPPTGEAQNVSFGRMQQNSAADVALLSFYAAYLEQAEPQRLFVDCQLAPVPDRARFANGKARTTRPLSTRIQAKKSMIGSAAK